MSTLRCGSGLRLPVGVAVERHEHVVPDLDVLGDVGERQHGLAVGIVLADVHEDLGVRVRTARPGRSTTSCRRSGLMRPVGSTPASANVCSQIAGASSSNGSPVGTGEHGDVELRGSMPKSSVSSPNDCGIDVSLK